MTLSKVRIAIGVLAIVAALGGIWAWRESHKACCAFPDEPGTAVAVTDANITRPQLGLMTSLPLYWPLGAELSDIASSEIEVPWQRTVLEESHELVLLDTLTPIPGLSPDDPETDPLEGLERLAIIQPRGLSPADNAALDEWVRAGGQLLLVLDPMLSGEYDLALGDPRRPVDAALIPPVVERWGLSISFDEERSLEPRSEAIGGGEIPLLFAGNVAKLEPGNELCGIIGEGVAGSCEVGEGWVTVLADATVFEEPGAAQSDQLGADHPLLSVLSYAFQDH